MQSEASPQTYWIRTRMLARSSALSLASLDYDSWHMALVIFGKYLILMIQTLPYPPTLNSFPPQSQPYPEWVTDQTTFYDTCAGDMAMNKHSLPSWSLHSGGGSVHAQSLSSVQLFATPRPVACQAPLSMGFSRQEYWSGLPFSSPGDLPDTGIKAISPALAGGFFTSEPPGNPEGGG